ncbi:MAG: hypothetical protein KAV42_07815, partial [Candidatus Krumholzibacteria bacterium]|nr:hypothetical protein [Candidatus Krumholzibacteria bacterium]
YPPSDTLLYLMTTSLVHGSRGIHMRALDFTMMCGNGGGASEAGTYRCPPLLLNWGPSVETTNPDMISRLLNVVQMLTGKNTSDPDFMSALIDENYVVLNTTEAQNAIYTTGWQHATWNVDHNFIALEETESEDVLLLVVNDSSSPFEEEMENYIYFPNRYAITYSIEHIAGFECPASRSDPELNLYYYGMPAYSASLYLLEYTGI